MNTFNHSTQFSSQKNSYLYLENDEVKSDDSSWIMRTYYSLKGMRDYNLAPIFKAVQSQTEGQFRDENLQFLSEKLTKKVGFKTEHLEGVKLLSSALNGEAPEVDRLNKFFEAISGNKKFNEAIAQAIDLGVTLSGVNKEALEILRTFSFKMKKHEEFSKAYQKVVRIQSKMKKDSVPKELSSEEKLTLKELNMLETIAKMKPIALRLKKVGLTKNNKTFIGKMTRQINGTENFLSRIQNIIEKDPKRKESGLIFYDLENFAHKRDFKSNLFHTLLFRAGLGTNLFHASMQVAGSSRKGIREAHIWGKYEENRRNVSSYVFKTLTVEMEKVFELFPVEEKKKLEALYGSGWKKVLKKKFQREFARFFEDSEKFQKLKNHCMRRTKLGASGACSDQACFQQSHTQQREFSPDNGATCSEFASKSIFHVYDLVSMSVVDDWNTHQKRKGNSERSEPPLLPSGINPYMDVSQISPSFMAKTLMDRKLASVSRTPKIVRQIVNYNKLKTKEAYGLGFDPLQIDKRGVIPNSCRISSRDYRINSNQKSYTGGISHFIYKHLYLPAMLARSRRGRA